MLSSTIINRNLDAVERIRLRKRILYIMVDIFQFHKANLYPLCNQVEFKFYTCCVHINELTRYVNDP